MALRAGTCFALLSGAVLVLAGVALLVFNFWADIEYLSGLRPNLGVNPYAATLGTTDDTSLDEDVVPEDPAASSAPAPHGSRVVIAKLGLNVQIFGGDANRALERGVYHHAGSAAPGERGNVVIAGHRNRRQFALLHYLEPGDAVAIYWEGAEYEYRVTRVYTVTAVATEILARGAADQLTLYTCTPRFLGNKRTVVVAVPK